jgi:hypothetical protein
LNRARTIATAAELYADDGTLAQKLQMLVLDAGAERCAWY